MADDSKPQAGFLTGKKVEPAPAADQTPEPSPIVPKKQTLVGFLKRGVQAHQAAEASAKPEIPATAPPANNGTVAGTAASAQQLPRQRATAPVRQTAVPAAAPGNRPLAEQYLHKGLDHYDRQETDQALAQYLECVKADPTFSLGHNNLGMVLIDLERYDEAISSLYDSIRCDPEYAEAYNNLGFVLRRTQRHVEAACAYERFLTLEPEVEEGPRIQGWMETVLKENNLTELPPFSLPEKPGQKSPESAQTAKIKKMAAWEVAVNAETAAPVSALGEVGVAPAQGETLKTASALPSTKRPEIPGAEKYTGTNAETSNAPARPTGLKPTDSGGQPDTGGSIDKIERGLDYFAEGELDQAAVMFQQAAQKEPENAEAHTGLGKVLVRQENFNAGIEELHKAIQCDPNDPAAYYVLGFALRAIERNVEASEAYETFLQLMPEAVDTEKMRQWIRHVKGAASVGIVEDNSVVEDEELVTETDQKYKAALQRFKDGDVDNSLRDCVRILNEDAAHYRTRVLLGRIFLRQKQYDNAVEQLEGALVTRPDFPEALYFLGQAAEKRGSTDLVTQSYKRYIDISPQGPRAERINEWLTMNVGGGETASQAQCELCLRFFPGAEIAQHEGKSTCRNCLSVMGAAPAVMEAPVATIQRAADAAGAEFTPRRGRPKFALAIGGLAVSGAVIGTLSFLGKLDPVLIALGIKKPKVIVQPTKILNPGDQEKIPDPIGTAVISGEPQLQVYPFAKWTFAPNLTGADELDRTAKGWTKELKVKAGPPGMAVDTDGNTISWTPPADWDTWKAGETYPVELSIRGLWKDKGGKNHEMFAVAMQFVLSSQFGYELSPEIELGLNPIEQIALAAGDLNGDGIADLVVCSGQFRQGAMRLYINRGGGAFAAPLTVAAGARFSAVWIGDLDGDRNDDILAANWQSGKLTPFYRDGATPVAGVAMDMGPGPVALAVGKMDESKNVQIASLQGVGQALQITTLASDRKFGELVRVPMPSGGRRGWIFQWMSAQSGPGFLVVVPLAENPLQFVPYNKGAWNKSGGAIQSAINDIGLIVGAAVLSGGPGKPQRLALIVTKTGNTSYVLMMEESSGSFSPLPHGKTPLSGPGLGLLARDFNQDAQEDLFVVMLEESSFYFCDPQTGELKQGPVYKTPRMRGLVVALNSGNANRPDLLLLDENAKARILRDVFEGK